MLLIMWRVQTSSRHSHILMYSSTRSVCLQVFKIGNCLSVLRQLMALFLQLKILFWRNLYIIRIIISYCLEWSLSNLDLIDAKDWISQVFANWVTNAWAVNKYSLTRMVFDSCCVLFLDYQSLQHSVYYVFFYKRIPCVA